MTAKNNTHLRIYAFTQKYVKFTLVFFLLFSSLLLSAQTAEILRSDSPTFNEFRNNSTLLNQVKAYADTIYPRGRIILDPENSASLEFDDIPALLGADPGSSFILTSQSVSKIDPNKVYYQYKQFHQGIQVDNGGYTILAAPPGAVGGCNQSSIYGISPGIATGIKVNTKASISQQEAAASFGDNLVTNTSELSIAWGLTAQNVYHLVYKVNYLEGHESYKAWVDAHNGSIIKSVSVSTHLDAPTIDYCIQDLDDAPTVGGGGRRLETEDSRITTYSFGATLPNNIALYTEPRIPTTNDPQWNNPAFSDAYQAHFCVSNIIPLYNELIEGIDEFEDVNVGVTTDSGARSLIASTPESTFIYFGYTNSGDFYGINDVVAHELTHTFLSNFLDYDQIGNASFQEGISDMFGTYFEFLVQNDDNNITCTPGVLDWIIGDDVPGAAQAIDRDLANPEVNTWAEAQGLVNFPGEHHKRSTLISHWFYLISEGGGPGYQIPIPALGIERATEIVLESLPLLQNRQADFPDFMEAVEMVVDLNWGPCSMETSAVRRAFKRIGLGDSESCAFVNIKTRYCESDAGMQLCIEEGFSDDLYRWYFPSEWTVQGAGSSNSITGNCLTVLDWPEYAYYPQNFSLRLYNVTQEFELRYNIRMEDCEGDDPGCNDVASITPPISETAEEKNNKAVSSETYHLLRIFDINGRKIYEGKNINQSFKIDNTDGLLIYCYYDHYGKIINTEKVIIIK